MPNFLAFILLTTIAGLGDPFAPDYVGEQPPYNQLKLGVEHLFWSYYTEGLQTYYAPPATPFHDFSPVMRKTVDPATYSEHPFLVHEWTYEQDYWQMDDDQWPKADWTAAEIAELFTIDVFPTDPDKDHRLLQYNLGWPRMDMRYENLWEVCAGLLNDPDGHVKYAGLRTQHPYGPNQPDAPYYTYYNEVTGDSVYFLRTWTDGSFSEDEFVTEGWDFVTRQVYQAPNDKIDCYTSSGALYQKNVGNMADEFVTTFAPGEMGPGMVIMDDKGPSGQAANEYDQTVSLHPGWNLVSWQIKPLNPPFLIADILPDNLAHAWFHGGSGQENIGELYQFDNMANNWPDVPAMGSQTWELDWAYYIHMTAPHIWDEFEYRPLMTLGQVPDIEPSSAWAHDQNIGEPGISYWFFLGYAAPGLCKLASEPIQQIAPNGNPANFSFEGPFHWLIWQHEGPHRYDPYDLKIVKTDDGKVYLPNTGIPPTRRHVDEIGVLEPGRGYFLGFSGAGPYTFDGWQGWPQWRNDNYMPPELPGDQRGTASAGHFQYNQYTHWSYPIIIDTVDQAECPMAEGDQIGVFDGDRCVGAANYPGEFPLKITCWEDDIATPEAVDGYLFGNPMTFIWYDASANAEVEFTLPPGTQAIADDPIVPDHSGFGLGLYARRNFGQVVSSATPLPQEYKIRQNFPNPFNAETVIPLELPQRSKVRLEIFNVKGQQLGLPFEHTYEAGWPKIRWSAAKLPSGIYFYRITAEGLERGGKFVDAGKMLVLK